jgi:hypothetical protein
MLSFKPLKSTLFYNEISFDYKEIMSHSYNWDYSKFWDSVRIDFNNGNKIVIFNNSPLYCCRFYSAKEDKWVYMSSSRGKQFIDGIKNYISNNELRNLLTW